ncbi:hypothetical protein TNCV_4610451 [Trichonephila clavipes]|nr:hypothetical protein TNCV_4610451 [Trichonephila clavipes]
MIFSEEENFPLDLTGHSESQNVGWSSSRLCLKPLALSHLYEHHPPSYSHPDTNIACYADDIAIWHSHNDITESEKALNTTLKGIAEES